jgi:hypothetical protein
MMAMAEEGGSEKQAMIREIDVPVTMRDGVVLRANVFRPRDDGRYPGILVRTPYGKAEGGYERFVDAGYVVVVQDTRGRYTSEGEYVPFEARDTGDGEDGYDSVEWLAKQPYCNGRVGTMGASYNAWMQWVLARLRPPHLVAMCAQSISVELTELDYPGAFRPARRVHWWMTTIAPDIRRRRGLPGPHTPAEARRIWEEVEGPRWLYFMPWAELPDFLPEGLAEHVDRWLDDPRARPWGFDEAHSEIEVPNLDFSGWFDHCNGTMGHLRGMQRNARTEAARAGSRLIIGPWSHVSAGQSSVEGFDFGPRAEVDVQGKIIQWFDHWLRGIENGAAASPPVRYFVMGSGRWRDADTWPPETDGEVDYFLDSEGDAGDVEGSGRLVRGTHGTGPCDSYVYDPRDPVPTLWTPRLFTVPSDRRELEYRKDILYYRSPPLEEEVEVVGYPRAVLFASSSAPDTDFFARLVDDDPSGQALEISYGMVRARYRNSMDREEPLTPGQATEFDIRLGPTACRFGRGHRIRLEITSSDFPNFDRNHNTGGNDLAEIEMMPAEQRVYHAGEERSRLTVGVREED